MAEIHETPCKKWGWPIWVCLVSLAAIGFSGLLMFVAGMLANQSKIPTELEKTPADYLVQPPAIASATSQGDVGFVTARRVRSDNPNAKFDYAAFLEDELRERPDLEGARQYLKLSRRFHEPAQHQALVEFYYDRDIHHPMWRPGQPMTKYTAEWLRSHAELVGQLLELAEGPGPPIRTYELLAQDSEPDNIPSMDFFSVNGVRILTAEADRRFSENDLPGAQHYWRAAIKLSVMQGHEPYFNGVYALLDPLLSMRAWIKGTVHREALLDFRAMLAKVHQDLFPPGNHSEYMALFFSARRKQLVSELKNPWYSPTFGWGVGDGRHDHTYFVSTDRFELPRVDRIALGAVAAIHKKKQAAQILSDFDQNCGRSIRMMSLTWTDMMNSPPPAWKEVDPLFDKFYQGYYHDDLCHKGQFFIVQSEADLNLLRAAIEYKLHSQPPAAITDRESPWRDPFTEKPMRIVAGTSNTLRIYGHGAGGDPADPPAEPMSPREIYIKLKK